MVSKFFKSKKQRPTEKAPDPRSMDEIKKAHAEVAVRAGSLQYQIEVYKQQLSQLNQELFALNNEGAARQKLDATTKQETTNG